MPLSAYLAPWELMTVHRINNEAGRLAMAKTFTRKAKHAIAGAAHRGAKNVKAVAGEALGAAARAATNGPRRHLPADGISWRARPPQSNAPPAAPRQTASAKLEAAASAGRVASPRALHARPSDVRA